ncbi:MAG: Ig domain-containing protein [Betaproteobacteria bacterium]
MLKARYIQAVLVLAWFALAPYAHATVTAFLSAGASCNGANSANFTPGGPALQVSMCVSATTERVCGTSYRFLPANANENSRFIITARNLAPAFNFSNVAAISFPVAINTPASGDLGSLTPDNLPVAAAANQLVATFEIAPQVTATNSSYQISLDPTFSMAVVDQDNSCGGAMPTLSAPLAASFVFTRSGAGNTAPAFTSVPTTNFTVGIPGSFIVTASGSPTPTFALTGTLPPGISFNAASGLISGVPTTPGSYPLVITASNGATTSQMFTLVVTSSSGPAAANQTISFAGPAAQTFSPSPIALTATSTSGLTVVFSSSTPLVCTVNGAALTMIAVGICNVNANQAGNANYNPALPVTHSFAIVPAPTGASNVATLSTSVNPLLPAFAGRDLTLTTLVRMLSPAGTVTFAENGVAPAGCAQRSVSLLADATDAAIATCTLTAPTAPASGNRQIVITYTYPPNHPSGRTSELASIDIPFVTSVASGASGVADYTDMWWVGSSEDGWGMSITQHGLLQFNVIFAYDNAGRPLWYVMPGGSWNANQTAFTGALYQPTSSPFSNYNRAQFVPGSPVGSATVTYLSNSTATLTFTINGINGTKSIRRQVFAANSGQPRAIVNDLWWAGTQEDGWGMNIAQQDRMLFPVWYTYDAIGRTTFFTVPGGTWNGTSFTGDIYTTVSSAWLGVTYNPAQFIATKVGTMTLNFTDQNNATMTYTVNGITQTKSIVRQPF